MTSSHGGWRDVLERLLRDRTAVIGLLLSLTVVLGAILTPLLPLADPYAIAPQKRLLPILSEGHPLGTDNLGRDILSRLLWGSRLSLLAGVGGAVLSLVIGASVGIAAGYFGGRVDTILMRVTDVVLAFPTLILALAIVAALGSGLTNAVIALAIASYPLYSRVVRSVVLTLREREFVTASVGLGAGDGHIVWRHILPNLVSPLLVTFTLDVGTKIVGTASLSFLGLGTQPPVADWGSMLATGRSVLTIAPHVALVPAVTLALFVLALNMVGDALNDAVDPVQRR